MLSEFLIQTGVKDLLNFGNDFLNIIGDGTRYDLKKELTKANVNPTLSEFILKCFDTQKDFDAYAIKSYLSSIELPFPSSCDEELEKLKRIPDARIKAFILDITSFMQHAFNEHKNAFGSLHDWTIATIIPEAEEDITRFTHYNPRTISLLSLCYPESKFIIEAKHLDIEFDLSEPISDISTLYHKVIAKYNARHGIPTSGKWDEFTLAIDNFARIYPVWSKMKASVNLRNGTALQGGAKRLSRVNRANIVRLFTGDYGVVPSNETPADKIAWNLIINNEKFDTLSDERKKQVTNALIANKEAFNSIVSASTRSVIGGMQVFDPACFDATVSSHQDVLNPYTVGVIGGSSQVNKELIADTRNCLNTIYGAFNNWIKKEKSSKVPKCTEFLCDYVLPTLTLHKSTCISKYGDAAQVFFQRLSGFPEYAFFDAIHAEQKKAAPVYVPTTARTLALDGGRKRDVPEPQVIVKYIRGGAERSPIDVIISNIIKSQREYVSTFDNLYKELIREVGRVRISDTTSNSGSVYTIANSINAIALTSSETPGKLSGLYKGTTYNIAFTRALEDIIKVINSSPFKDNFNGVKETVSKLIKLQEEYLNKAKEYKREILKTPKRVSEFVGIYEDKMKVYSSLNYESFNAMDLAIRRIVENLKNFNPDEEDKNTRSQVDNYISGMKNRTNAIREFYANKQIYIKSMNYNTTLYKDNAIQTILSEIINIKRDKLIYLNEVVEPALAQYRSKKDKKDLRKDQISKLETAAYVAKNQTRVEEFKRLLEELNDKLNKDTRDQTRYIFQIIKDIKRVFLSFGYMNYIKFLYTELEIFPSDFNWNEFAENISTLVAVSTINITNEYVMKEMKDGRLIEKKLSLGKAIDDISKRFVQFNGYSITDPSYVSNIMNSINPQLFKTDDISSHDPSTPEGKTDINFIWNVFKIGKFEDSLLPSTSTIGFADTIKTLFDNRAKFGLDDATFSRMLTKYALFVAYYTHSTESHLLVQVDPRATQRQGAPGPAFTHDVVQAEAGSNAQVRVLHDEAYNAKAPIVEYKKSDKLVVDIVATDNSILNSDMEVQLVYKTIDALMANILYVIDSFWSHYYTGNLNLPIKLSQVMSGGSIFDKDTLETTVDADIIPEATPFYICAFIITHMYVKKYSEQNATETRAQLVENKMSPIYPVLNVFKNEHANVYTISPQQMKVCIKVFNEIWNQGTGSDGAKLNQAIDNYFSEINACIVFASDAQIDVIDSGSLHSEDSYKEQIRTNIEELVKDIRNSISSTVMRDDLIDPKKQIKYFEETLANAYRMIKNEKESQRLMLLKQLLSNKTSKNPDMNSEFFKFMDLVITPLLICTETYYEIFKLFEYSESEDKTPYELDLSKRYLDGSLSRQSASVNSVIGQVENITYWDLIRKIQNLSTDPSNNLDDIFLLFNNTAVRKWNRILIQNAITEYTMTGKFTCPHIWNVLDVKTYPKEPVIKQIGDAKINSKNITILQQLYPHLMNATSISEYFDEACSEFLSDITQFVNTFNAYPDISDSVRDSVSKSFKNWKDTFETRRKDIFSRNRDMEKEQIPRDRGYVPPPAYQGIRIPNYQFVGSISGIIAVSVDGFKVDWTGERIKLSSTDAGTASNGLMIYDWPDWVIYQLAKCDKINYCLPSRFIDIIYDGELNKYVMAATFNSDRKDKVIYQKFNESKYYNIVTQNIMLRSMNDKNKREIESYSSTYIASIVAICPYIISTLIAVKGSTSADQSSILGYNVIKMLDDLILSVKHLYNEFIPRTPFTAFMAEVSGTTSSHIYGEVLDLIHLRSANKLTSAEFTKLLWANKCFFNTIPDITFPVYTSKNQFEDIEKYAKDKIESAGFNEMYENNKKIIGKNAWMCLIAKNKHDLLDRDITSDIGKIILNSMHILSECNESVITQFVQNIISLRKSSNATFDDTGMIGGGELRPAIVSSLLYNILGNSPFIRNAPSEYSTYGPVNPFPIVKSVYTGSISERYKYETPDKERILDAINGTKYNYFSEMADAYRYTSYNVRDSNRYAQIMEAINACEDRIHKDQSKLILRSDAANEIMNDKALYTEFIIALLKMQKAYKELFNTLIGMVEKEAGVKHADKIENMLKAMKSLYVDSIAKLVSYSFAYYDQNDHSSPFIGKVLESGIFSTEHPLNAFIHYLALIHDNAALANCMSALDDINDIKIKNTGNNAILLIFICAWIKNANSIAFVHSSQSKEVEDELNKVNDDIDGILDGYIPSADMQGPRGTKGNELMEDDQDLNDRIPQRDETTNFITWTDNLKDKINKNRCTQGAAEIGEEYVHRTNFEILYDLTYGPVYDYVRNKKSQYDMYNILYRQYIEVAHITPYLVNTMIDNGSKDSCDDNNFIVYRLFNTVCLLSAYAYYHNGNAIPEDIINSIYMQAKSAKDTRNRLRSAFVNSNIIKPDPPYWGRTIGFEEFSQNAKTKDILKLSTNENKPITKNNYTIEGKNLNYIRKCDALFIEICTICNYCMSVKDEKTTKALQKVMDLFKDEIYDNLTYDEVCQWNDYKLNAGNYKRNCQYAFVLKDDEYHKQKTYLSAFGKFMLLDTTDGSNTFRKLFIPNHPRKGRPSENENPLSPENARIRTAIDNLAVPGYIANKTGFISIDDTISNFMSTCTSTNINLYSDDYMMAAYTLPATFDYNFYITRMNSIGMNGGRSIQLIKNKAISLLNSENQTNKIYGAMLAILIMHAASSTSAEKKTEMINGLSTTDLNSDIKLIVEGFKVAISIINIEKYSKYSKCVINTFATLLYEYLNNMPHSYVKLITYISTFIGIFGQAECNNPIFKNISGSEALFEVNPMQDIIRDNINILNERSGNVHVAYVAGNIVMNGLSIPYRCFMKDNTMINVNYAKVDLNQYSAYIYQLYQNLNALLKTREGTQEFINAYDAAVNTINGANQTLFVISGGAENKSISVNEIYEVAHKLARHPALKAIYKANGTFTNLQGAIFSKEDNVKRIISTNGDYFFPPEDITNNNFEISANGETKIYGITLIPQPVIKINLGRDFGSKLNGALRTNPKITKYFNSPTKDMYVATIYGLATQSVDIANVIIMNSFNVENILKATNYDVKTQNYEPVMDVYIDTIVDENAALSKFVHMFVPSIIHSIVNRINPKDAFNAIISSDFNSVTSTNGFDLGISGGSREVEQYLNVGRITGLNIVERMISAYSINEVSKNVIESILRIHTTLFGSSEDPISIMYGLIMKYFRKRDITLSSIYNHIVFPNIIYGSAVFRFGIEKISDVLNALIENISSSGKSSVDTRRFTAIQSYLNKIVKNNNFNNAYKYAIANKRTNVFDAQETNPSDIHSSLSIVNEHLNAFLEFVERNENNSMLFCSILPSVIQQIDMIITIITMVLLVVKETGVYDSDTMRTRSIINANKGDPFFLAIR